MMVGCYQMPKVEETEVEERGEWDGMAGNHPSFLPALRPLLESAALVLTRNGAILIFEKERACRKHRINLCRHDAGVPKMSQEE